MKKRYFFLIFFLLILGVSIFLTFTSLITEENADMDKVEQKDEVGLSFKNLTLNTIDDILKNTEKINIPPQEKVDSAQEEAKEKIDYAKKETSSIIDSLTSPFKKVTNNLAKQLISWLLSLLTAEELKELLKSDFGIDICN